MNGPKKFWMILAALAVVCAFTMYAFWRYPMSFFDARNLLWLEYSGFRSRTVEVNGIKMHYYVAGPKDGRPIVLVHGLGGRAENWSKLGPGYADWLYRVYLIDLPGFGQSDRPADFSYSISDQAEMVNRFMTAVGLQQADLGGWSMGGWIVQRLVLQHPERVRRLTLFDSAGLRIAPDWDLHLFSPASMEELMRLEQLLTPQPKPIPEFVARDILRRMQQNSWVTQRALNAMLSGRDTTDLELATLRLPVLILWGEEDRVTPMREGRTMSELIPQAQFMWFPGCGHLAPLECADQMEQVAIDFGRN